MWVFGICMGCGRHMHANSLINALKAIIIIIYSNHVTGLDSDENRYHVANYNSDVLLGNNYAVSRTRHRKHTESQLLNRLPRLLQNYRDAYAMDPPAVFLYTRGTTCSDCTNKIAVAR